MRGGKREGAGRKPVLSDPKQRWAIGGECERLWQEAIAQRLNKERLKHTPAGLMETWERLRSIPAEHRKKWLTTSEGQDTIDDAVGDLRDVQGVPDDEDVGNGSAGRLLTLVAPRPLNVRPRIIERVANSQSKQHGRRITPRFVSQCWKEFRALQTWLEDEQRDV